MTIAAAREARQLLNEGGSGVMSSLSLEVPGYPFGSVVQYCLDYAGRPVILISALAEHTKNLMADPRCSLMVMAAGDEPLASGRLTLLGRVEPLSADEVDEVSPRYYRYFPDMSDFHRQLDFRFYRLRVERIRYVAGFARVQWLEPGAVLLASPFSPPQESGMVEHMNADHQDAIQDYLNMFGLTPGVEDSLSMAGLDAEGIHLKVGKRLIRIPFDVPVSSPLGAREALVALAKKARNSL